MLNVILLYLIICFVRELSYQRLHLNNFRVPKLISYLEKDKNKQHRCGWYLQSITLTSCGRSVLILKADVGVKRYHAQRATFKGRNWLPKTISKVSASSALIRFKILCENICFFFLIFILWSKISYRHRVVLDKLHSLNGPIGENWQKLNIFLLPGPSKQHVTHRAVCN